MPLRRRCPESAHVENGRPHLQANGGDHTDGACFFFNSFFGSKITCQLLAPKLWVETCWTNRELINHTLTTVSSHSHRGKSSRHDPIGCSKSQTTCLRCAITISNIHRTAMMFPSRTNAAKIRMDKRRCGPMSTGSCEVSYIFSL